MKPALVLSLVTALGIGGAYLVGEPRTAPVVIVQQERAIPALEKARRSVFKVHMPKQKGSGTAILIGRTKLTNGNYRYRALTAQHVLRQMMKDFEKDKSTANYAMDLMFQPDFHGAPLKISVNIHNIDWANVIEDWASFTFDMSHKISCAPVATKAEFESIKPFEVIYAVGCGGRYAGQHCRKGIIGATHNEERDSIAEQFKRGKGRTWNRRPSSYFRPYINIWYGDSGGAVFSKDGKLIGLINGYVLMGNYGPVTHSAVAVKAHLIREVTKNNPGFFLVEK
jgi:hypothetical protein